MNKVPSYNLYRVYLSENAGRSDVAKEANAFIFKVL